MHKALSATLWVAAATAVVAALIVTFDVLTFQGAIRIWAASALFVSIVGYFTAQNGRWFLYLMINLASMAFLFFSVSNGKGGSASPTNFGLILMVVAIPIHAAVMFVIGGAYWFFRRERGPEVAD